MNFLPKGYEQLKSERKYWKMSEMKDGDNRLRIVQAPIAGWLDWIDNKPMRYKPDEKPSVPFDSEKPIKGFWSCYVWDYARNDLFILEITQQSVIKAIVALANDSDWGDFTTYDLKITKTGSLMKTRYQVTAIPHKPISKDIQNALKSSPVRLEALYEGKDPWVDLEAPMVEIHDFLEPIDELRERLEVDGVDTSQLSEYILNISTASKHSSAEIIVQALDKSRYNKFKQAYLEDTKESA